MKPQSPFAVLFSLCAVSSIAPFPLAAQAQTEPQIIPAAPSALAAPSVLAASAAVGQAPSPEVIQSIVDMVKPTLVRIHVVEATPRAGRDAKRESFGSGVIISPDGYVVTNHHVAGEARWLSCTLSNKERVEARLIGTDPLSDLAIIKLEAAPDGKPYPVALWGDSSSLRVGETVLAMGSPFAFSQSVTAGIVSNTELVMQGGGEDFQLQGEDVGSIVRWIGHDAPIHPGNSGGPLVNLRGEIIGINEIQMGLSGAIPGDLAREVSAQIIARGRVLRAYTGLDLQPRLRSDTRASGVLISGVVPASPAAKAGLKAGDLLLEANGQTLDARFSEQLPQVNLQLSRLPLDRATPFRVIRGGREMSIEVKARARDKAELPSQELKSLGITATDITPPIALEWKLPDTKGAMVTTILSGGPAAEAKPPLEEGDVILMARGKTVNSVSALRSVLAGIARREGGTPTLFEVRRRGERVLCVADANPQSSEDASVQVARSYLPVSTQVVTTELAQALKLPSGTQGVRITQVHPGSAAAKAGLQLGDVIVRLDSLEVEASQPEDTEVFETMIRQYPINGSVVIKIFRQAAGAWKPRNISLKLPRAPKQERELATYRDDNFGLTLRSVTYSDRLRQQADTGEEGALVTNIDEGSWAALAGLGNGDIIRSIDGVVVKDMESARKQLQALEKARSRRSVFFVSRGVHTVFLEMQTEWSLPAVPSVPAAPAAKTAVQ